MGTKAKGLIKGKKTWRANINTEDIEVCFEKSTKDTLSGGTLESLFYVDKSKGVNYNLVVDYDNVKAYEYCYQVSKILFEVDNGSDDENVENLSQNEETDLENRSKKPKPVTQVKLNKRAKRKELERKESEVKKSFNDIIQKITKEDKEKQRRHLRLVVAKQERLKACPPRLRKHKFEPAHTQVLLTEGITESVRKLKGCCTLVKNHYKSLEKRALVVSLKSKRGSVIFPEACRPTA